MKIAILSDTHDNIWKLAGAIPRMETAQAIVHCGDIIAPFTLRQLLEGVGGKPVHVVWGNNDGDRLHLADVGRKFPNFHLHGELAMLELDGLTAAVNHYPDIARGLARGGAFGLVCYGHDHVAHEEWVGETLLLNPGEVMGKDGRSSLVLLDTASRQIEWVDL
jgi:hypothetical protein